MAEKIFKCPVDGCFETDKQSGWRKMMGTRHGGYTKEQLQSSGLEENVGDRIRYLSGFRSLEEVRAAAPETEGASEASQTTRAQRTVSRQPRLSKDEQEKIRQQEEFERLRPMLLRKWERRLRTPFSLWAKIADDPKIMLTDDDAKDGAAYHVDMMLAMGWTHVGKIEAWGDLAMWWGATILGRSDIGQQLMASFSGDDPTKDMSPGERDEYLRKAKEHLQ